MTTSSTSKRISQQSQQQDSSKIYEALKKHSDMNLNKVLNILEEKPSEIDKNEFLFNFFIPFYTTFDKNLKFDGKHFYDNLISDFDLNIFVTLKNIYNQFIEKKNGWVEDKNLDKDIAERYYKVIHTEFQSHKLIQDNFTIFYKNGNWLYQRNHMFFFYETKKNTLERTLKDSLEFTVKYIYDAKNEAYTIGIHFFRSSTQLQNIKQGWQYFFCFLDNPFIHITRSQKEQTSRRIRTEKQKQQKPTGMHTGTQITDRQLVHDIGKLSHAPTQITNRQLLNDFRNFPNPDENSSFYLSILHRYAMNIGYYEYEDSSFEKFSHGYGIYSDMKLQEFIYNLKKLFT